MKSIYIYGASGHGLVVSDIAKNNGYNDIIFIDDGDNDFLYFEDIKEKNDIPIVIGIGSNKVRKKLFEKLEKHGFNIVSLIHSTAVISSSVKIEEGTVVMPRVVINTNSKIAKGVILNTGCIIEHENIIEDFAHISPGVILAGDVTVKNGSHVGIGSCVIQGLTIGANCLIGANSTVVKSIPSKKLAYGNPCKIIKEINE
jgi:UDP-N-acetylbacillosamine N-acetyltransferase